MAFSLFAAGSLKKSLPSFIEHYQQQTKEKWVLTFGPAGLLRERIEQGETCHLFLSADKANSQQLVDKGIASTFAPFIANQLCITAKKACVNEADNWLSLLANPLLTLAISTPKADPSGDYSWQLFDKIEKEMPQLGQQLKERACSLVGGKHSIAIPNGEIAAHYLITSQHTDLFIGYQHYQSQLRQYPELKVFDIPANFNITALYCATLIHSDADKLYQALLSFCAQQYFIENGFLPLNQ